MFVPAVLLGKPVVDYRKGRVEKFDSDHRKPEAVHENKEDSKHGAARWNQNK